MVKLIYDSIITGHHSEYINHLVKYLIGSTSKNTYHFIVPEEIKKNFPEIINQSIDCEIVKWVFIPQEKIDFIQGLPLYKRSFFELALVEKYAKKLDAEEVFLLYFNIFQLALCFKKTKFFITGILFFQFYRMDRTSFWSKIKYYRKYLTTKSYARNKSLKKIFVLNDQKTVDFLNTEFNTDNFEILLDPIPEIEPLKDFDIYKHYGIDINRAIYLHIGSLDSRKGTFEVLESLKYISKKRQNDFCLLLVGKSSSALVEQKIYELIHSAQKESDVQVIWDNQFVDNALMKSLFDQCKLVLMPYKNTEASSGILGHAMASNKVIITTGSGLLKDIVDEYEAGFLLEEVSPKVIAEAIEKVEFLESNPKSLANTFVMEHSVEDFVNKIIGS